MTEPRRASAGGAPRSATEVLAGAFREVPRVALRELGNELHETPVVRPPPISAKGERAFPDSIGPYQVTGEIAHGGVGIVLKARDVDLGRDVAVKILHARHRGNLDLVRRFVEEAQIGSQLQHPGILPVHGMGVLPDGLPYLAMKLVKGRTLAGILENRRDPGEDRLRLLGIFERLCQTLAYAHARRVVHRDLKPANVMVGAFGEMQLMDWGLAKVLSRPDPASGREKPSSQSIIATIRSTDDSSQSLAGSIFGTPAYMAPEQARGQLEQVDERSDVFGLGAILCEILTGEPPYTGESREQVFEKARKGYLDDAMVRLDRCDAPELAALARRALAFEPRERPPSAGSLAAVVESYLGSSEERRRRLTIEVAAARARAATEGRARRLLLGLSAAAAVLIACAGWAWRGLERESAERQAQALGAAREGIAAAQTLLGEARAAAAKDASWETLQGPWQGAIDTANEAERRSLLGAPRAVMEEAKDLAGALVAERDAVRASALRRDRNRRLLARLEEIRLAVYAHLDSAVEDLEYRAAFEELELEDGALEDAVRALEATGIAGELADAVVRWAWAKLDLFGERSRGSRKLKEIADRIDPDPRRRELRDALFRGNARELFELAAGARGEALPPSTLELLADGLLSNGGARQAKALLDAAIRLEPASASLHLLRNRVAAADRVVLESWIPALSLRPENADLIGWVGLVRFPIPDRPWSEEAVRLQPWNHLQLGSLGRVLIERDDTREEAARWLLASLRLNPFQQPTWHNYALVYWHRGELEEAARLYQRALRDRRHPLTLDNLGYTYQGLGNIDAAIAVTLESISRRPGDWKGQAALHYRVAQLLDQKGDPEGAASRLRIAQELDPRDGSHWILRGELLARRGSILEAMSEIQQGLEKETDDEKALLGACSILSHLPAVPRGAERTLEELAATLRRNVLGGKLAHPRWDGALLRVHEAWVETMPPETRIERAREIAARRPRLPALEALPGLLLWESGARREAIAVVEAAARLDGAGPAIGRRLDELRRELLPELATFASIDDALEAPETLVREGDSWRFFRGFRSPSPGLEWTVVGFDDAEWEAGASGFGYGDGDDTTVLDDMRGRYKGLYIRRQCDLPALLPGDRVVLRVLADDGFAVYVNGAKAGGLRVSGSISDAAPGGLVANDHEAGEFEEIDITGLCRPGINQLALLGLNATLGSSDFTLLPELVLEHGASLRRGEDLLARLRGAATGPDAAARVAYLEGRLHHVAGRAGEALAAFERTASLEPTAVVPLERLLAARDAAGQGAEALAGIDAAFAAGARATPALIERWLRGRRAAGTAWSELLAAWPRNAEDYSLVLSPRSTASAPCRWRFTSVRPERGWEGERFVDDEWSEGPAPFGRITRPTDIVPQSRWGSSDLWLRRRFTCDVPLPLPQGLQASLVAVVVHDDDVEVYLNGAELTRRSGWSPRYTRSVVSGTGLLREGDNVLAVHCHNLLGDGIVDVELALRISMP